jgi:hydrogenase expression/formation protein HypE
MADHGVTILTQREGLTFESTLRSDSAPLNHMVTEMVALNDSVHVLRDPTRGGVGTALNEIAQKSDVGIKIIEKNLPVKQEVASICELLGFDPLYLANEGKLLAIVSPQNAEQILEIIQRNEYGRDAAFIGEVVSDNPGRVYMETRIGGTRIVDMLVGEQLPRIC